MSRETHIPIVAVIDPALKDPATICLNELIEIFPGVRFTVHYPALFPSLPSLRRTDHFDAVIILGSAAFVTADEPWMRDVADFAIDALHRGVPILGCCFGHQLMAQALGATIDYVTPEKAKLSGLRRVCFSEAFLSFKKGSEASFVVTHRQQITSLPPDLEQCASSPDVTYEAIRHRRLPFWGVQSHPEASRFFMTQYLGGFEEQAMERTRADGVTLIAGFLDQVHQRRRI